MQKSSRSILTQNALLSLMKPLSSRPMIKTLASYTLDTIPSLPLSSKPTTSPSSAKTSLPLSEALTIGTPLTRPTIQLEKGRRKTPNPTSEIPWLVQKNIRPMLDTLGRNTKDGQNIVTLNFNIPYTDDPDELLRLRDAARAEAITALTTHLTHAEPPTTTFVFEKVKGGTQKDKDKLNRLQNAGVIPPITSIFAEPTDEPLLWGADLLAWASRHLVNATTLTWLDDSKIKARFLDSHVQTELKTLNIRPLNQPSPRMKLYDEDTYREAGTPGTRTEVEATYRTAEANGTPVSAGPDKSPIAKTLPTATLKTRP